MRFIEPVNRPIVSEWQVSKFIILELPNDSRYEACWDGNFCFVLSSWGQGSVEAELLAHGHGRLQFANG